MPLTTRPASTSRHAMIRLESTKVLQNPQARCAGFFRVKLDSEYVIPLDRGGELASILSGGRGLFDDGRAVGVCVIDERAIVDAAQQPAAGAHFDLVPAYVRRLDPGREARTLAGEDTCAWRIRRFYAALKQPLHAHADSEKRFTLIHGFKNWPA